MRTVSFAILASATLLAGCSTHTAIESRYYSNERSAVSISYSTDLVVGNSDKVPALEKERAEQESDFLKMGFARTRKLHSRPLMCRIKITGDGHAHDFDHIVTCRKRGGMRQIVIDDDKYLSTMLTFIFPDEFKKLVPAG